MITKKKLVAVATTLTLGLGLTAGLTPAFAHSDESSLKSTSISSASKQEQPPFTGYIISVGDTYMTVANTPTKEEALEGNWGDLVGQGKILIVPVPKNEVYAVGEKVNVFYQLAHFSNPPIAILPTIEKVSE
ncbi:hypothetical protein ERICIV_00324 [Paenibacillus larvae subsp. larvae]|uniref:DUF3221 domain-containing protein n=2 Tax=Paenibacillus larvae TaxID=1464 RepID=A0A1V0UTM0_9BACL|nr:DUF3221 domain-containing protein [Paenibacillus larvae]AQT85264.1 DUF3221 domain-containing protein [Paenibacillus larvae subsp. pulvifaciens]AQZ47269.1 DUF3221 domain-containing protein [Paenibacillus larvae subsp. pulvifaciens]ARF68609.1 DUF3221 domain-containing protein [Paenibacillus larvae subsp. pulvifaciens]AVF24569.1 hypothetical protein ERICIII_00324 [Paenibacillus larvae subsp. larvae]AVF29330.1 hypothetical protein ERICIV_00324 [Paenibacillus larvae subsp. larvae]